jgi:hypothetical protein
MELISIQTSRNTRYNHLIFLEEISQKSYASSVLLKEYYRSLEDPGDWQTDWRYYFIVRRHWLRKQKKNEVWVCHYCGKEIHKMPERNKQCQNLHKCVTVDHKVPKSEGIDILDTHNFLVACYDCNTRKKSTPYEIFMKGILWAREQRNKKIRPEKFKKVA